MRKTKVLIVDDSALMREILGDLLTTDPDLQVVGSAGNPYAAWDKIKRVSPDVLTLDVEMPRMDGLTFLERLMSVRPTPVVMVSSLTEHGCETALRALELGAVDIVAKPRFDVSSGMSDLATELTAKVRGAGSARIVARARPTPADPGAACSPTTAPVLRTTHKVVAIGTSTGGTEALVTVLSALPADAPGVVAVIHMPEGFTRSYAARLDRLCAVRVAEARDGDRVLPGHVLLAPGNYHTTVARSGVTTTVRVTTGDPVNRHRPSVDVLFASCAAALGPNAVGAILTGMGDDGARGLLAMRQAGAATVAQNEETCVVFGMPREAIALGAADAVLPLDRIPGHLLRVAASA